MTFVTRIATQQDIATVDALLARAYPRLLKPDYSPSMLVMALPKISRAQPDLVTCGTYFVVEQNDLLVGAGGWTAQAPGQGRTTRGVGHIRHVVTDDRVVRRGVARRLLSQVFASASGQGVRRLNCLSTLTAVPFYEAMGFVVRQSRLIPLGPGIEFPAVEMERDL